MQELGFWCTFSTGANENGCALRKEDERACTGFIWLRIGTIDGFL
jgi:hypothetical protein